MVHLLRQRLPAMCGDGSIQDIRADRPSNAARGRDNPPMTRITIAHALKQLARTGGASFVELFKDESLSVEIFRPREADSQKPHSRDEIYVVMAGMGEFERDGSSEPFGPGDVIVVPAGVKHRFASFSSNLTVWVFFHGPERRISA
jgi:mannose-6-phosphate isomerase-like protein (cupin superfamily)